MAANEQQFLSSPLSGPRILWSELPLIMAQFCLCSQNPTSDEVLSWSQNFDKMMKAPAGRNLFREFLRTEYSEENLLFWLACEDLKKEQNKKVIEEKARMIYEDYISILSPKEVKIWKIFMGFLRPRMNPKGPLSTLGNAWGVDRLEGFPGEII